jgi:hypothetical protein
MSAMNDILDFLGSIGDTIGSLNGFVDSLKNLLFGFALLAYLAVFLLLAVFSAPSIIAGARRSTLTPVIVVCNVVSLLVLFFLWPVAILLWVIALVLAVMAKSKDSPRHNLGKRAAPNVVVVNCPSPAEAYAYRPPPVPMPQPPQQLPAAHSPRQTNEDIPKL